MWIRSPINGWILDHGMFPYGDHFAYPVGVVSSVWNSEHKGRLQLLHE